MNEINSIWFLEQDGNVLFRSENDMQNSEEHNSFLFSGMVMAIQSFIKELGEEKIKQMELGNSKIFISKDEETDLILVLKTNKEANNKRINKFMEKIQEKTREVYYNSLFTPKKLKEYIKNSFKNDLEELFKADMDHRVSKFFESI